MRYFTEPMKKSVSIGQFAVVMYVLPLILLPRRRDLLLWCIVAASVIVPVFLSDLLRTAHGLAYVRYTFPASAAVYALAAAMLWHMRGFFRILVPVVLTVACIAALEEPYSNSKADSREMARFVAQHVRDDDVLLVHTLQGHDWQARAMYLALSHYHTPGCPVIFLGDPPSPALEQRIRRASRIWVMAPSNEIPLQEFLPGSELVRKEAAFFPWVGVVERVTWPAR
jgi:hypothetical protein